MHSVSMPSMLILLLSAVSCVTAVENVSVDVVCTSSSPSSCEIFPSKWGARVPGDTGKLASAWFSDSYAETGWAHLEVASFPSERVHSSAIDSMQAYAAGLAEGFLTGVKVSQHFTNTYASYWGKGPVPQPFVDYIETNLAYMRKQSEALGSSDSFWQQVGLILTQMQGLLDGSNRALAGTKLQTLSFFDLMVSNIGAVVLL